MPSSDPGASDASTSEVPRPQSTDFPTLLRFQAEQCAVNGSPLYATLLAAAASDVGRGGPCLDVLRGHEKDPLGTALVLRFIGGVHRLALEGDAPALAAFYPSAGGSLDAGDPWPAFRSTVAANVDLLRDPSRRRRPDERGRAGCGPRAGLPDRRHRDRPPAPSPRGRRERGPQHAVGPVPLRGWRRQLGQRRVAGAPCGPMGGNAATLERCSVE